MSDRRISMTAAFSLILLTMLAAGCTCSEQECKSRYGLVEPPLAVPTDQTVEVPTPEPQPGPLIDLGPSGGANVWRVNTTPQGTGGPANGELRDDFIGQSILVFDIKYDDGAGGSGVIQNADQVTLGRAGVTLVLERSSQNTALWRLDGSVLTPSPLMSADKVPSEFTSLEFQSSNPALPAAATFQELTFRVTMK